jgi:metallo-beta-lactamase class B
MKHFIYLLFIPFLFACNPSKSLVSKNEKQLAFYKIKKNTFVHISFLQTQTWGKVGCNGMIYIHKNQAFIFDTPADNETSEALIKSLEDQKIKIKGVVVNHFHNDCLGGLEAFHKRGIKAMPQKKQ